MGLQQRAPLAENVLKSENTSASMSERGVYVKQSKYMYTAPANRPAAGENRALEAGVFPLGGAAPPLPMNLISIASNGELTAG
jgi:hypothetical protein